METRAEHLTGTLTTESPAATRAVGRSLGEAAMPGLFVALSGPLGAGKTQLTKGLAEGLAVTSVVNSPTFVLMNEHVGRLRLFHVDAYRLTDATDAVDAGLLDDRQVDGVTALEWADRLAGWLPLDRLEVAIAVPADGSERRDIRWTAIGATHVSMARAAFERAALGAR